MFICSCNSLTDKDVHAAITAGATHPRDIYAARKCKAQCGNCVSGVVCLLREAIRAKKAATLAAAAATESATGPDVWMTA